MPTSTHLSGWGPSAAGGPLVLFNPKGPDSEDQICYLVSHELFNRITNWASEHFGPIEFNIHGFEARTEVMGAEVRTDWPPYNMGWQIISMERLEEICLSQARDIPAKMMIVDLEIEFQKPEEDTVSNVNTLWGGAGSRIFNPDPLSHLTDAWDYLLPPHLSRPLFPGFSTVPARGPSDWRGVKTPAPRHPNCRCQDPTLRRLMARISPRGNGRSSNRNRSTRRPRNPLRRRYAEVKMDRAFDATYSVGPCR